MTSKLKKVTNIHIYSGDQLEWCETERYEIDINIILMLWTDEY